MSLHTFLAELRRRRVVRVAAVYLVAGWLVIQVATAVFPALLLPDWLLRAVVLLVILGFPVTLGLAWAFDITPEGVVRTGDTPAPMQNASGDSPVGGQPSLRLIPLVVLLVLAVGAGGYAVAAGSFRRAPALEPELDRSIVVLPFRNLSTDAENEYFSDGITEDILGRLSRMGELRVISRSSAMSYKGSNKKLREIGQELNVAHVLEGSVRRIGNRVRISAQLVDARTDRTLWSDEYDREASDVFGIQTEIAEQIAQALRLRLTAAEQSRVGQSGTSSLAAYELYLKAREMENRIGSHRAESRALHLTYIALLRQALALDPEYAPAAARLSGAYLWHADLPREERYDSAVALARRAIRSAPELADGYAALGAAYVSRNPEDPGRAAAEFRRALELDPNRPEALLGLADVHWSRLQLVEALRLARRAASLAPTEVEPTAIVADIYANLGHFDRAEEWYGRAFVELGGAPWLGHCQLAFLRRRQGDREGAAAHLRQMLAVAPEAPYAWRCAGGLELSLGNDREARAHLERYAATVTGEDVPLLELGFLALRAGEREKAHRMLAEAEQSMRRTWEYCDGRCSNSGLARVLALRGDVDEAIRFLHRAAATGWNGVYPSPGIPADPMMGVLAGEPRYEKLMAELRANFDRQRERALREGL